MTSVPHLDAIPADLPIEIVILILHEACRSWPQFRLTLSLTSSWARRLALSHLYSTIIANRHTVHLLSRTLKQEAAALRNPPFEPASQVRGFWLERISDETPTIFTVCRNMTHVALDEGGYYYLLLYSTPLCNDWWAVKHRTAFAEKPIFEMLLIDGSGRIVQQPPTQPPPLFSNIPRLWIGMMPRYNARHLRFEHLTRLTHLAIPYHDPSEQELNSLVQLFAHPRLTCLVLVLLTDLLNEEDYKQGLEWVVETRQTHLILYVLPLRHESLRSEWERSQLPGESIWERAALFTQGLDVQSRF